MRKEKTKPYLFKFQKHLLSFIKEYKLWEEHEKLYIALSGGIDSIVLLHAIHSCGYYNSLEIIHINHQTREDNHLDEKLVAGLGQSLGLKVHFFVLDVMDEGNFEAKARGARYNIFKQFVDGKVLLGHHIDDSFEWSLMQKFKSSTLESTIGIPVINKHYRRPFMCVTKSQIKEYAKIAQLTFNEDSTNCDTSFERNFIREHLISHIREKYPKYLKHYVNQSNALISKSSSHIQSKFKLLKIGNGVLIYAFSDKIESIGLKKLLYKSLSHFEFHRGKTASQIDAIVKAHLNAKRGPLVLSGGIKVFLEPNLIFLSKNNLDEKFEFNKTQSYSLDEFKNLLPLLFTSGISYPFYVYVSKRRFNFQASCVIFSKKVISPCKLIKYWERERNRDFKLDLSLPQPLKS